VAKSMGQGKLRHPWLWNPDETCNI